MSSIRPEAASESRSRPNLLDVVGRGRGSLIEPPAGDDDRLLRRFGRVRQRRSGKESGGRGGKCKDTGGGHGGRYSIDGFIEDGPARNRPVSRRIDTLCKKAQMIHGRS
jgi:hypothetical protein